jgi:hypothetical protein
MSGISRRDVLALAGVGLAQCTAPGRSALASEDWDSGEVVHILPTASASEIMLKVSFATPQTAAQLTVNGRPAAGDPRDSEGRFWRFRASDLPAGRRHELVLRNSQGPLCGSWTLATLPAPDAEIDSFRILSFTCAGGLETARSIGGVEAFRPLALRQRLLERALSFSPDIMIANGDHIYWDQRAWLEHPLEEIRELTREAYDEYGYFDKDALMTSGDNEALIKRLADPQIAHLYGTRMRSLPTYFIGDDHDYFENDDAFEAYISFPPDDFMTRAGRAVQSLYYPEFLPSETRPVAFPGASAIENGPGISEAFGTIRAGRLFEAALYDCGRFLTLKKESAGLVPPRVEQWLIDRTLAEDTSHFLQIPSHPAGWTAGKWREWYPDVVAPVDSDDEVVVSTHGGAAGELTIDREKYAWQSGWFEQHQRLMKALSAQSRRPAAMLSGDLHAIGHGRIMRSRELDLTANPVHSILAGPLGSSTAGWPTFARGVEPTASALIELEQAATPSERNGFTLIDVEPDRMIVRQFSWREPDPVEAIDSLQPDRIIEIARP